MNIVFDIDNTIFFKDDKALTTAVECALLKLEREHNIYIATRREKFLLKPIERLSVANVICANGAYDINSTMQVNAINTNEILPLIKKYPYMLIGSEGISTNDYDRFCDFCQFYNNQIVDELDIVSSIVVKCNKNSKLEDVLAKYDCQVHYVNEYQNYIIAASNASKQGALSQLNIDCDYAFGDDLIDDLPMLLNAKIGILVISEQNRLKLSKLKKAAALTKNIIIINREQIVDVLNSIATNEMLNCKNFNEK